MQLYATQITDGTFTIYSKLFTVMLHTFLVVQHDGFPQLTQGDSISTKESVLDEQELGKVHNVWSYSLVVFDTKRYLLVLGWDSTPWTRNRLSLRGRCLSPLSTGQPD